MQPIHKQTRVRLMGMLGMGILLLTTPVVHSQQPWPVVNQFEAQYPSTAAVQDIEWHPNDHVLAVATADGFQLLNANLEPIPQTQIHTGDLIRSLSWSPSGSQVALTFGTNIEIWEWNNNSQTLTFERTLPSTLPTFGVFWSPNGRRIASIEVQVEGELRFANFHIWQTVTWRSERVIDNNYFVGASGNVAQRLVWAPDGSPYIACVGGYARVENRSYVGAGRRSIYRINVETGETTFTPLHNDVPALSLDWQPGGNLFAVGGIVGTGIYNLDLPSDHFLRNVGTPFEVPVVQWDPSGTYVASSSSVERVATGELLGEIIETYLATALDWKHDGFTVTTADYTHKITNWDARRLPNYTVPLLPP